MLDTVIFDVGNVMLRVENDPIRQDMSEVLKVDVNTIHAAWGKLIPDLLGKGKISEKEFWKKFLKITGSRVKKVPKDLLYRQLEKNYTSYSEVLEVVKNLKTNKYKLGIISDTIESHAEVARKHGIFKPFDTVILSYQVGLRKPDPEIFKLALKKLNSKPENSVFIDDIELYVETAKNLGLKGIVFKDPSQLKNSLNKLGINFSAKGEAEETNIGAHALLISENSDVILQQRTSELTIDNPGMISMFGGTIKKKETAKEGLRRELYEELNLKLDNKNIIKLGVYKKTKKLDGIEYTIHVYLVKNINVNKLNLKEGAGFAVGKANTLLKNKKLTRITKLALTDYLKQ